MRYVIVGAGPSGVIAAETLRKVDRSGDITLIGGEPGPPYSRMAIPYYLAGGIDEAGTHIRKDAGHYDALDIRYVHGLAERVAPADRRLTLEGGESFPYDRLLVATGASAVRPPVSGLDLPGVHTCWTMEDARAIHDLAREGADVVLIGAGFIGCIILEALVERRVNLTVVEVEDRMVPRMMNAAAGAMLKRWCEAKGVRVLTSTRVTGVEGPGNGGGPLRVSLDPGAPVRADLVVVATGVRSNMDFVDGSEVKTATGIVVDDRLATSADGIFAAGDVAEGPDFSGGWMVHAIQPTSADHGRIAALNMAGRDARYQGSLIMNVLDTAGLISASFGRWQGTDGGDFAEATDEAGYRYIRLAFDGDRLIGALCVGRTEHVGVLRGLIQSRVALGEWKARLAADPHRIMEAYLANTQA